MSKETYTCDICHKEADLVTPCHRCGKMVCRSRGCEQLWCITVYCPECSDIEGQIMCADTFRGENDV